VIEHGLKKQSKLKKFDGKLPVSEETLKIEQPMLKCLKYRANSYIVLKGTRWSSKLRRKYAHCNISENNSEVSKTPPESESYKSIKVQVNPPKAQSLRLLVYLRIFKICSTCLLELVFKIYRIRL
jgi:hypothetical protein